MCSHGAVATEGSTNWRLHEIQNDALRSQPAVLYAFRLVGMATDRVQ